MTLHPQIFKKKLKKLKMDEAYGSLWGKRSSHTSKLTYIHIHDDDPMRLECVGGCG